MALSHFSKIGVAPPAGLEPATRGVEDRCSIRLSYEGVVKLAVHAGFEPAISRLTTERVRPLR